MNQNNNFGKYFFKLSSEDQDYLLTHENGNKSKKIDLQLLHQRDEEHAIFMAKEERYLSQKAYKHPELFVSN
jgi:hypothetical protein